LNYGEFAILRKRECGGFSAGNRPRISAQHAREQAKKAGREADAAEYLFLLLDEDCCQCTKKELFHGTTNRDFHEIGVSLRN
jgi:hypothetical protein